MKVRNGSNKSGCFLEVAVFVEGGWSGVIRLPEGRGGWVWRSFVDELWHLLVPFVAKDSPTIPVVISGVDGTLPNRSYAAALAASLGGLMSSLMDAQAPMEVCSEQRRSFPLGGGTSLL